MATRRKAGEEAACRPGTASSRMRAAVARRKQFRSGAMARLKALLERAA